MSGVESGDPLDLAELGRRNDAFRQVVHTDCYTQITLMSVRYRVPNETHQYATQVVTVQGGKARVTIGKKTLILCKGQTIVIPPATAHAIVNDSLGYTRRLKLLVHYSPPLHPPNEVSRKQPEETDSDSD